MSAERWAEVSRLLDDVLDLAPAEREAFLEVACAGDPELRGLVDALLAADEGAGTFLGAAAAEKAAPLVETLTRPEGRRIGPYRVLTEIGEGGMGTVYLAERADGQFEQRVALKVTRPGLSSDAVRRRFLYERQILARLQHPNIARLYDGGVTGDGRPYFAMEYVEGVPLTTYCDRHRLDVEQRLALFLVVCEAVRYAHRNLVVHRDLKPSNILVTEAGAVKLLDFGIAKVLAGPDEGADGAPTTQTGSHAMTPEYAAPEQLDGSGITTATDVYALGVLLYELLTGARPYRFARKTPAEVERVLREVEPERPSSAVGRTASQAAPARGLPPDRLRRRLTGDLDTIVLQALRKEPERRYASAEALADDIRRHLRNLPVTARPDTFGYRARKFVRRHRVGVAASVLVVALAAVTVGVAVRSAVQVAAALEATRQEAEKAAQVSAFLVDLFNVSNPFSSGDVRGDTLTARTLLARGARRAGQDLARQPAVQAEMMHTIGQVYRNLNMFAEADTLLQQALARRRRLFDSGHEGIAASLSAIGQLRQSQGDYPAAESLHREALAIRRSRLGDRHRDVAESQYHLAIALTWQNEAPEEAEALLRQSLATRQALFGQNHLDVAYTLNSLGNLLVDLERFEEAEAAHREALAIRRQLLDARHPTIAVSINNLAYVLRTTERFEEAEALYEEALSILRDELGAAHLYLAIGLNNLADVLAKQGKHREAEPRFREALQVFPAIAQQGHALEAVILSKWGASLAALGRFAEAEAPLLKGQARIAAAFGEAHPFTGNARDRLARLYEAWGRPEDAAAWRTGPGQ